MAESWSVPFPDEQVAQIADDIHRQGYGMVADFLIDSELELLRRLVYEAGDDPKGKYSSLQQSRTLAGTALAKMPCSPSFRKLCERLYEMGTGIATTESRFYQVFRCLKGDVGQKNSYFFHYDTYVLTVLVPIIIPDEGARGDLLMFPNVRRIKRTYLHNLFDKALVDNPISQKVLRFVATRRKFGALAVRMKPGNIYFFWGYRSIHANEPCNPEKLRATALIHFGDPYTGSRTRNLLRAARHVSKA